MREVNSLYFNSIKSKLLKKNFTVGIIGLGYVGLPLALTFCEKNIRVIGFDINNEYIKKLNNGKSYIHHINSKKIANQISKKLLKGTCDFKLIQEVDVILICVPTPLNKYKEPDLSFVNSTMSNIKDYLKKGQIIILESTTYPGTTEEQIKPILEKEKFKVGEDLFLIYSPEREDPGNKEFKTEDIPKILGGYTEKCSILGEIIYKTIIKKVVTLSSTKAAEMTKLVENVQRAVNIGLMNELKLLSDSLDIDIYEIINAASTKPFGFTTFYPGPGLGGHCIPIDPFYLSWKAKEFDINLKFIELAGEINSSMPSYIIRKISDHFNEKCKSIKNSKILILGMAYKKNVDDLRESPSLKIGEILINMGANLSYCDPYIKELPDLRKYNFKLKSIDLTAENLRKFDCTILATDHDIFDYELIKKNSIFIIDTRGKYEINKKILRG